MKILIVDDEKRAREGLCHLIGSLSGDYELVGIASNGQEALDQIVQVHPDVVFTDIKMPYMDGLTLIRNVREMKIQTQFVIVTVFADFEYARQSISLDVIEYILKPMTKEDVEKVLKRVKLRMQMGKNSEEESSNRLRDRYPNSHPLILQALDLIEKNYAGKINQREMAEDLNISPEYFSYLFSKNIGETFSTFLQNYRIQQAELLYSSGKCDRREVPYMTGFSDPKYFAKVFRRVTGQSPSEYISGNQRNTEKNETL